SFDVDDGIGEHVAQRNFVVGRHGIFQLFLWVDGGTAVKRSRVRIVSTSHAKFSGAKSYQRLREFRLNTTRSKRVEDRENPVICAGPLAGFSGAKLRS